MKTYQTPHRRHRVDRVTLTEKFPEALKARSNAGLLPLDPGRLAVTSDEGLGGIPHLWKVSMRVLNPSLVPHRQAEASFSPVS